jgi:hypothetical protein
MYDDDISLFGWIRGGAAVILLAFGAVGVLVLLGVFGTWVYQNYEGGLASQHTKNQRHEIGYVDAQNQHCEQVDIPDYNKAKAQYDRDVSNPTAQTDDEAQMNSALSDCRNTVGQLSPDEVAAPVAQFLAAHP